MKKLLLFFSFLLTFSSLVLLADYQSRGGYGRDPISIVDTVVDKANEDYRTQETALDGISTIGGEGFSGSPQYRLTNTLYNLKNLIHPYLQWLLYIGLTVATVLVIYNGFLLVTGAVHNEGEFSKIKKNLIAIGIGVILLTGFYFLIDLVIAIMNFLFD
jgi:hypothetical protein